MSYVQVKMLKKSCKRNKIRFPYQVQVAKSVALLEDGRAIRYVQQMHSEYFGIDTKQLVATLDEFGKPENEKQPFGMTGILLHLRTTTTAREL